MAIHYQPLVDARSNMNDHRLPIEDWKSIITEAIESSVEKTVNGKIRNLDAKLELYIQESKGFHEVVQQHIIKSDKESEDLKPLLERVVELTNVGDGLKTVNNFSRFLKWASGFTVVGGSAWYIITRLTTKL